MHAISAELTKLITLERKMKKQLIIEGKPSAVAVVAPSINDFVISIVLEVVSPYGGTKNLLATTSFVPRRCESVAKAAALVQSAIARRESIELSGAYEENNPDLRRFTINTVFACGHRIELGVESVD